MVIDKVKERRATRGDTIKSHFVYIFLFIEYTFLFIVLPLQKNHAPLFSESASKKSHFLQNDEWQKDSIIAPIDEVN